MEAIMISSYDNFHGDEMECDGFCMNCEECDIRYYQACEDAYERFRDDELYIT